MIEVLLPLMVLYIAWSVGSNMEVFSSVVGSRVTSFRKALIIACIAVFFGACLFGSGVSKTLREGVTDVSGLTLVISVLVGAGAWIAFSSWMGWTISTTASIVGGLVGVALFSGSIINWFTVLKILASWLTSPIIGFFLSFFFVILISRIVNYLVNSFEGVELWELRFAFLQLLISFFTLMFRAANDVAQAVFFVSDIIGFRLLAAFGMSVGLFTLGRVVVKSVGLRLTKLNPSSGLAVQLSTLIALAFFTFLGVPVSGSVIFVSAMAGAGFARGKNVNKSFLKQTVLSWLFTLPVSAVLSALVFTVLRLFL